MFRCDLCFDGDVTLCGCEGSEGDKLFEYKAEPIMKDAFQGNAGKRIDEHMTRTWRNPVVAGRLSVCPSPA